MIEPTNEPHRHRHLAPSSHSFDHPVIGATTEPRRAFVLGGPAARSLTR
jgi:hypothetical protein